MTTVISFIGKGIPNPNSNSNNSNSHNNGYRETNYLFDDNVQYTTSFLGKELARHIKADRLILIGTASSSWDVLLDGYTESDEASLELYDAIEKKQITENFLQGYSERFSANLGCKVECILIDFARDEASQVNLLLILSDMLLMGEKIAIDVTHSFRHLPMLAMVAARYLRQTKDIEFSDIYYGAYEMRDAQNIAPVINLKGMLNMLDWVDGLTSYDKDSDFSVFSDLLAREGVSKESINHLNRAAFHERISSPKKAQRHLESVVRMLNEHTSPIFSLFKNTLISRMSWRNKPTQAERELAIAKNYLEKRDFIRAAIYLLEGLITKSIPEEFIKWDEMSYDLRDTHKKDLLKNAEFRRLNALRNALAHGDIEKSEQTINTLLTDEEKLYKQLQTWLVELPKMIS